MKHFSVISFITTVFGVGVALRAVAFTSGSAVVRVVGSKPAFGCVTTNVSKGTALHVPNKGRNKAISPCPPWSRVGMTSEPVELDLAPYPQNVVAREHKASLLTTTPEIVNSLALGTLLLTAVYGTLHNDMAKLAALPHNVDHFKAALSMLKTLPTEWLAWYDDEALSNPLATKASTSCVCYFVGDLCAQGLAGKDLSTIRLDRAARSAVAGFIGHGPIAHYWLGFLDSNFSFGGAWWAVIPKIIMDQGPMAVVYNTVYSLLLGTLAFRDPREVLRDVQAALVPALRASIRFWPAVHLVTFSALPVQLQLLWIDIAEIIWVCILSRVNNEGIRKDEQEEPAPTALP